MSLVTLLCACLNVMHKFTYLSFNWLITKINNETLRKNLGEIHGVVYDLGCGIRPYENDILKVADRYIGVDWSSTLHEMRADVVADLNKPLPVDDKVANTVVSFQVMEHLCEPQIMLNEAHRILKPGGTIFLTVPWQWWIHEKPYDFYRYTPYGLDYMFNKAGFIDVSIEAQGGFFTMWVLKLNYFTKRFVRGPLPFRWFINAVLIPLWYIGQVSAPYLDILDWRRELESPGFYVIARKQQIT